MQPQQKPKHKRALSAGPRRPTLRIDNTQDMNSLRNSINSTFKGVNRSYQQITELTQDVPNKYKKRIDRMCEQYCIVKKNRYPKKFTENIDSQFIARMYVRSRSKDSHRQKSKKALSRSIEVSARRKPLPPQDFFKFDRDTLVNMSERDKKRHPHQENRMHPYVTMYEDSQKQAVKSLLNQQPLDLGAAMELPPFGEAQDWQRQRRQIKGIYTGIKRFRAQTARTRYPRQAQVEKFFVT